MACYLRALFWFRIKGHVVCVKQRVLHMHRTNRTAGPFEMLQQDVTSLLLALIKNFLSCRCTWVWDYCPALYGRLLHLLVWYLVLYLFSPYLWLFVVFSWAPSCPVFIYLVPLPSVMSFSWPRWHIPYLFFTIYSWSPVPRVLSHNSPTPWSMYFFPFGSFLHYPSTDVVYSSLATRILQEKKSFEPTANTVLAGAGCHLFYTVSIGKWCGGSSSTTTRKTFYWQFPLVCLENKVEINCWKQKNYYYAITQVDTTNPNCHELL